MGPSCHLGELPWGQALSHDRVWGNLPGSAPLLGAASPQMRTSTEKIARLAAEDSQNCPAVTARLWPQKVPALRGDGECNEDEL